MSVSSASEAGRAAPSDDGRGYDLHAVVRTPPGFVDPFVEEDAPDNLVFQASSAMANGSDLGQSIYRNRCLWFAHS